MAMQVTEKSPLLIALMAMCYVTHAATLEGRVQYPGRAIPAATVYARNVESGALQSLALKRSEAVFRFELPAGRYWVFVRPQEPGLTELYAAHTHYSECRLRPSNPEDACTDHGLNEIDLTAVRRAQVAVDDWFLDDASAIKLDQILGAAGALPDATELGRPRFSEYRAPALAAAPVTRLTMPAEIKGSEFARELNRAASEGANFAGGFALVRLSCGEDCEQIAIVDLGDGSVLFPETLARLSAALPCRGGEVLVFRDDSRLLQVTRPVEGAIETDYLLWNAQQRAFSPLAKYQRTPERFCATAAESAEEPEPEEDAVDPTPR